MIGDNPTTDIKFGKAGGIDQCLVLSGVVHNMDDFETNWLTKDPDFDPTWIMQMVGDRTAEPYRGPLEYKPMKRPRQGL